MACQVDELSEYISEIHLINSNEDSEMMLNLFASCGYHDALLRLVILDASCLKGCESHQRIAKLLRSS